MSSQQRYTQRVKMRGAVGGVDLLGAEGEIEEPNQDEPQDPDDRDGEDDDEKKMMKKRRMTLHLMK